MIKLKNITKTYGNHKVLDNVSLEVEEGSLTSFIGTNGAGKSTLLSIIARLLKADSGQIEIDGTEIGDWNNRKLAQTLSVLRQNNNIDLKLTVEELIAFGRFPYSRGQLNAEDHQKIEEAIQFMNLTEMRGKYLNDLSGGQQQRAFIAMIIAQDTKYILLDEPLNNLDMKHSVEIMQTLRLLCDELGRTVIIVIHDINFASVYSDRIVALEEGKLKFDDVAERIMDESRLKELFGLDFDVYEHHGRKVCCYYDLVPVQAPQLVSELVS